MSISWMWPYVPQDCPARDKHRGPEGPNEDIAQCAGCGTVSFSMRPAGETFGWHDDDCSLPIDHPSYCQPGGNGHEPAPTIRGYWPHDERSEDFRGH